MPKTKRLEIRLTAAELAELDACAIAAGMTRSAYVRACAVEGQTAITSLALDPSDVQELRTLSRRFAKVGGLLNQTARALHRLRPGADASSEAEDEADERERLDAMLTEARDALLAVLAVAKEVDR